MASEFRKLDQKISVLLVSGYAEQVMQREIAHRGYDFLPKPYSLDQLNAAVANTLRKAPKP